MSYIYQTILDCYHDLLDFVDNLVEALLEEETNKDTYSAQDDRNTIIFNNISQSPLLHRCIMIISLTYIVMTLLIFVIDVILGVKKRKTSSVKENDNMNEISIIDNISKRVLEFFRNRVNLQEKFESQQLRLEILEEKLDTGFANISELIQEIFVNMDVVTPTIQEVKEMVMDRKQIQDTAAPREQAQQEDTTSNDTTSNDTSSSDSASNDTTSSNDTATPLELAQRAIIEHMTPTPPQPYTFQWVLPDTKTADDTWGMI